MHIRLLLEGPCPTLDSGANVFKGCAYPVDIIHTHFLIYWLTPFKCHPLSKYIKRQVGGCQKLGKLKVSKLLQMSQSGFSAFRQCKVIKLLDTLHLFSSFGDERKSFHQLYIISFTHFVNGATVRVKLVKGRREVRKAFGSDTSSSISPGKVKVTSKSENRMERYLLHITWKSQQYKVKVTSIKWKWNRKNNGFGLDTSFMSPEKVKKKVEMKNGNKTLASWICS